MEREEREREFTGSILVMNRPCEVGFYVLRSTLPVPILSVFDHVSGKNKTKEGEFMPAIRISPEELKQKMVQEKFIILDLRQPEVYESSQEQIKGSIRLDPNDDEAIRRMIDNTDKNVAIVGYCT